MTDEQPDALPAQKLVFFGIITASLSHELKNVLATVNEYSGLLDDLSQAGASGRPLKMDRLQSICGKIAKQIKRGEMLIGRLNRFAHSVDEPRTTVDLAELLGRICDLCNRFAKLRQVALERRFDPVSTRVTVDPFALQYAVHLAIDLALQSAGEARVVTVSLEATDPHRVSIESADPLLLDAARPAMLRLGQVMAYLGGEAQLQDRRVVLVLG